MLLKQQPILLIHQLSTKLKAKTLVLAFLSIMFLHASGCSVFEKQPESADKILERASQQRIYIANYDAVWRAAHAVVKYTIASENQDFGIIETDYIKSVDGWISPDRNSPEYRNARYRLLFTFAKGITNGKESTRLTIEKKIELFRDFISAPKVIPTNGLEEMALFYRIERELYINQMLKRAEN